MQSENGCLSSAAYGSLFQQKMRVEWFLFLQTCVLILKDVSSNAFLFKNKVGVHLDIQHVRWEYSVSSGLLRNQTLKLCKQHG